MPPFHHAHPALPRSDLSSNMLTGEGVIGRANHSLRATQHLHVVREQRLLSRPRQPASQPASQPTAVGSQGMAVQQTGLPTVSCVGATLCFSSWARFLSCLPAAASSRYQCKAFLRHQAPPYRSCHAPCSDVQGQRHRRGLFPTRSAGCDSCELACRASAALSGPRCMHL